MILKKYSDFMEAQTILTFSAQNKNTHSAIWQFSLSLSLLAKVL